MCKLELRGKIIFIDEPVIAPSPKPLWQLNCDNFASMHFVNFDFHKSSAGENEVMENDVEVVKSEGRSDDWIVVNERNVERAVSCKGGSSFEVNFDGN